MVLRCGVTNNVPSRSRMRVEMALRIDLETRQRIAVATGLTPEELVAVEGIEDSGDATCVLSGSRIAGHGNAGSDVDLYVISDRQPVGILSHRFASFSVSAHFVRDTRVDYTFWHPLQVWELAGRLSNMPERPRSDMLFTVDEVALFHWLKVGIPLTGEDYLARWLSLIDYPQFTRYLKRCAMDLIDDDIEDCLGMMDSDDRDSCLLRVRMLLEHLVDLSGYHLGNTNSKSKWRALTLKRFGPAAPDLRTFWRLAYPPNIAVLREDRAAFVQYVTTCVELANTITMWTLNV